MPDSPSHLPTPAPMPLLPPFPTAGLTDGRVLVRAWQPDVDAPAALRLARDPDVDRWGMPWFVPRPVDVDVMRHRLEAHLARSAAGEPSSYAVVEARRPGDEPEAAARMLGDIGCRLDLPAMYIADLGYGTLPEARGRGVASAALRLLAEWLLDPVAGAGLPRVQLDHATANAGSCRVAVAAGFAQEGLRPSFLPLCDPDVPAGWSRHAICLHGRLADDS